MITPILTVPHEILRKQSTEVTWDKKTQEIANALQDTLFAKENPKGVGLSAPQIGKNKRMYVTWLAQDPEDEPTHEDMIIFINPVITSRSSELTYGPDPEDPILEGCLSIPTLYGPVPRHEWVEVAFETLQRTANSEQPAVNSKLSAKKREQRFSGFSARVIQHEQDHLDGVLFTDYSLKYDLPIYEFTGKKMKEIDKKIAEGF